MVRPVHAERGRRPPPRRRHSGRRPFVAGILLGMVVVVALWASGHGWLALAFALGMNTALGAVAAGVIVRDPDYPPGKWRRHRDDLPTP